MLNGNLLTGKLLNTDCGSLPNPVQILGANLKGWYRGYDAANTIVSGNQFSVVNDASGGAFNLNGGAGAANPTIAATPINGKQAFDFAAASVQFANAPNASSPGTAAPPYYLFGIIRPRANATTGVQRKWFGGQGSGGCIMVTDNGPNLTLFAFDNGSFNANIVGLANNTTYALTAIFNTALITLRCTGFTSTTQAGAIGGDVKEAIMGTNGGFGANYTAEGALLEWGNANIAPTPAQDNAVFAYLRKQAGV